MIGNSAVVLKQRFSKCEESWKGAAEALGKDNAWGEKEMAMLMF